MADITVDVNLPNSISVDITSPTQALATNISIPGPQGPRGEKGNPTSINNLTAENIIITGVDGNVAYTSGTSTIFISGNSGYFQSAVNSLTTNLNSTGTNLNTSINNLSGLFTGYTGSLDATYATDSQLENTGSTLNIKIDNLSGYVNSQDSNISNNLASTGSSLQTNINTLSSNLDSTGSNLNDKINSLSGTLTGNYLTSSSASNTYATISNLALTGSNLNTKIDNFSGTYQNFVDNLDSSYATDVQLQNTGSTLSQNINSLSGTLTGNYYLKSNPSGFITGIDLSSYLTSSSASSTYATIINLASTGSTLASSINSLNSTFTGFTGNLDSTYATDSQLVSTGSTLVSSINSLSGTLTSNYPTINNLNSTGNTLEINIASTGNTLNTKINSLSGDSVLKYNNQTINGQKTFTEDLVVQKSGFFWSGIKIGLNSIIISEESIKISGDPVIVQSTFTGYTGDVVNTYATITNLASTGSTLQSNINTLTNNLNSTGNTLDNKIGSLSGTLTSDYATIINLASTGSNLQTQINNLDNIYATDTSVTTVSNNLASTGSTLDSKINSLSGSSVLLYGNQSVGGIKTFRDNVYINNLFVTGTETIVNTPQINIASNYLLLNLTGGAVDGGIFFVTGTGLTGVNDPGPIIGFDHSDKFKFGISTRNSDLSTLQDIASVQQIEAYSGFVDNKYSTIINLNSTGSNLQTQINTLSNKVIYTTGNQIKSGRLAIGDTIVDASYPYTLSLQSNNQDTFLEILNSGGANKGAFFGMNENKFEQYNWQGGDIIFYTAENVEAGYPRLTIKNDGKVGIGTSIPSEKLHISGGNLRVDGNIYLSGNPVLTGVDLSSYATNTNLASTGSTLQTNINNLSGVSVLTFGNQTISGTKIFNENISGAFISGTYINAGLTSAWDSGPRNGYFLGNGHSIRAVDAGNGIGFYSASNAYPRFLMAASTLRMGVNGALLWNTTNDVVTPSSATDVGIYRDLANTLAQRNGTNPQQFRVYNATGTNSGEFGLIGWQNNQLFIGAQNTSSGISREVLLTGNRIISTVPLIISGADLSGINTNGTQGFRLTSRSLGLLGDSLQTVLTNEGYGGITVLGTDNNTVLRIQRGDNSSAVLNNNTSLGWYKPSPSNVAEIPDVRLWRDASGILALRTDNISRGSTFYITPSGMQFRVYNITGTNTGEFALFGWQNSNLIIGAQQSQSGILRDMTLTGRNININASGVLNIFDNTNIVGNLNVTGNILLSGNQVLTGSSTLYATSANLGSTGSTLQTNINNLSGYINSTSSNIVFTTGNQIISGNKTLSANINLAAAQVILGSSIYFEQPNDSATQIIDKIDTDLQLARNANGALFNPLYQASWNGANPSNTEWNNDGWSNLSNVTSRTYYDLYDVWGGGQIGNNIVGSELVLHDTANDKYYKIEFTNWQGGGAAGYAGFAYTRELIFTTNGTIITGDAKFNNNILFGNNASFSNRPTVNGVGVLLIGEAGQVPETIVQTSGTQTISGSKTFTAATTFTAPTTFADNITVAQTGIFSSMDVSVDEMSISGLNLTLTSGTGIFNNGIDLNNSTIINAAPQIITVSSNFIISGNYNSRMIMANSSSTITGRIVSGNASGFNTSIIQTNSGQVLITGSGVGIIINSYNNQFRTAGQYATISMLHTGNNGYIMYGNTST